jgi:hypothetical protein
LYSEPFFQLFVLQKQAWPIIFVLYDMILVLI